MRTCFWPPFTVHGKIRQSEQSIAKKRRKPSGSNCKRVGDTAARGKHSSGRREGKGGTNQIQGFALGQGRLLRLRRIAAWRSSSHAGPADCSGGRRDPVDLSGRDTPYPAACSIRRARASPAGTRCWLRARRASTSNRKMKENQAVALQKLGEIVELVPTRRRSGVTRT